VLLGSDKEVVGVFVRFRAAASIVVVVPETDTDKAFRKTAKSFIRYSPKQERIIIIVQ
jgi:hypothetical protein